MNLKDYLKLVDMTWADFARLSGIQQTALTKLARGEPHSGISILTAYRIMLCSNFKVTVEDIIGKDIVLEIKSQIDRNRDMLVAKGSLCDVNIDYRCSSEAQEGHVSGDTWYYPCCYD